MRYACLLSTVGKIHSFSGFDVFFSFPVSDWKWDANSPLITRHVLELSADNTICTLIDDIGDEQRHIAFADGDDENDFVRKLWTKKKKPTGNTTKN